MNTVIFTTTLTQTGYLILLVAIGFVLKKFKILKEGAVHTLSSLETYLLIPGICLATFMKEFTVEKLAVAWKLVLGSVAVELILIALSFFLIRLFSKEKYLQRIYQYALLFANFGYFGNAVVSALFPEFFADYLIFTAVLWIGIAVFGAPILMDRECKGGTSVKQVLKSILNPMVVAMLIGMGIGLSGIKIPVFFQTAVDSLGACMSPIAMLLSGMIFAEVRLKKALTIPKVYVMTLLRLLVLPISFLAIARLLHLSNEFALLGVAAMGMPIGLNLIVIPASNGDVPEEASGMVFVSHLLSVVTIPFLFWLLTVWA